MKRTFAAAVLAILLAACSTTPPGDSYPPYDPYPPSPSEPYPPPAPYPPTGEYYPPQPPPTVEGCPVISSSGWRAWVNAMPGPGAAPTLHVTGTVVTPAGHRVEFVPQLQEGEGYPVAVVARMWVMPAGGGIGQASETHDLNWQWPLSRGPVGSVTIECGNRPVAEIAPVGVAQ